MESFVVSDMMWTSWVAKRSWAQSTRQFYAVTGHRHRAQSGHLLKPASGRCSPGRCVERGEVSLASPQASMGDCAGKSGAKPGLLIGRQVGAGTLV